MTIKTIEWKQRKYSAVWVANVGWLSFHIDLNARGKYYIYVSKSDASVDGFILDGFKSLGAAKYHVAFLVRSIVLASITTNIKEQI